MRLAYAPGLVEVAREFVPGLWTRHLAPACYVDVLLDVERDAVRPWRWRDVPAHVCVEKLLPAGRRGCPVMRRRPRTRGPKEEENAEAELREIRRSFEKAGLSQLLVGAKGVSAAVGVQRLLDALSATGLLAELEVRLATRP